MVIHLDDRVRECYVHAKACGQIAIAETDPDAQQSFLDAREGWLKLALRLAESIEPEICE
jgi:hypothetical protein